MTAWRREDAIEGLARREFRRSRTHGDHRDPRETLGSPRSGIRAVLERPELHSMRMMLAPGAMACAHSTSRASSTSHSPVGSTPGRLALPSWPSFSKLGGSGRPKSLSNWASSLS